MAVIRRHWLIFTTTVQVVLLLALIGGLGFLLGPSVSAQTGAEAVSELGTEPTLYSEVQLARKTLALTSSDLAMMDCTQAEAEVVLEQLKSWCEQNRSSLLAARAGVRRAKASLRQAMQQIHVGPVDSQLMGALDNLKRELAAAQSQQRAVYDQAAQLVAGKLGWEKQTAWQTLRTNVDAPGQYRAAPSMDAQQREAIEARLRSRVQTDANQLLSAVQQSAVQTASANRNTRMSEVLAAESRILPPPVDPILAGDDEEGVDVKTH